MPAGRVAAFVPNGRPVLDAVQSGDAVNGSAIVWTKADRVARMVVEVGDRPDLRHARTFRGPLLTPDTDFTGKVRIPGIPSGHRLYYRVRAEGEHGRASEPLHGSLIIPGRHDGIRFVWTADLNGQGWGINPDIGGMRIFEAMRRVQPDFFLCSGDTIYADGPIAPTQALPDGRVYRNLTSEAKSHVAQTLADFRGAFAYNLLDDNLRRLAAEVPQVNQWDDHEVHNNWYPGQILADDRYTEKRTDVLAAARATGLLRVRADQPVADDLSQAVVRAAAGRLRAGHAHLQGPQRRQRLRRPDPRPARRTSSASG